MAILKKLFLIFVFAFLLNFVWENLHSYLYVHYKGGEITEFILARAALFDAFVLTLAAVLFLVIPYFRERLWYILLFGVAFAIGLEWFALETNRWAYSEAMPMIPILRTGLTPTIQLGLLGYAVYYFVLHKV